MAWTAAAGASGSLRFEEGVARQPGAGAELYREQHWIRRDGDTPVERLVLYRCPDGTAFARKLIDYRASTTAPAFALEDRRSGYREGLRRGAQPILFHRPGAASAERSAALPGARLVADAGFDEFVRQNWLALSAGQALPLLFAVPSRLRSLQFRVSRSGETTIRGEKAWTFLLKLDGLLGWVAPSISVSYGQATRRLLRFEGISNLRDDAGEQPLVALIDFIEPVRAASEAQWQASLRTPLSGCRTGR